MTLTLGLNSQIPTLTVRWVPTGNQVPVQFSLVLDINKLRTLCKNKIFTDMSGVPTNVKTGGFTLDEPNIRSFIALLTRLRERELAPLNEKLRPLHLSKAEPPALEVFEFLMGKAKEYAAHLSQQPR